MPPKSQGGVRHRRPLNSPRPQMTRTNHSPLWWRNPARSRVLAMLSRVIGLGILLWLFGDLMSARWGSAKAGSVALLAAALLVAEWAFALRRRLRRYEDRGGSPLELSLAIGARCPQCDGVLREARMEDFWGPVLHVASESRVRSDGSPVFEPSHLSPEESDALDWARGMEEGAWCALCRKFWPTRARNR